ncbi:hypothetical protein BDV97DRAFT_41547 [Delphinella strobiligena]|nr:hypothetical protein BDV97DRAFT_41547 [Delphinella strobiligena]
MRGIEMCKALFLQHALLSPQSNAIFRTERPAHRPNTLIFHLARSISPFLKRHVFFSDKFKGITYNSIKNKQNQNRQQRQPHRLHPRGSATLQIRNRLEPNRLIPTATVRPNGLAKIVDPIHRFCYFGRFDIRWRRGRESETHCMRSRSNSD